MTDLRKQHSIIFPTALTAIYFCLSLYGIIHHEIWLDEAHSFLIARDSQTLSELSYNTDQEGHPLLWYFLLWLLNKFSHQVFFMQLLHIGISSANIFLMTYFAPFGKIKKILFTFSYYFFYEYNILSRNYAIGMLLITVACILLSAKKRNYIAIAFVLALLAHTHFLALLFSFTLAIVTFCLLVNDKDIHLRFKLSVIVGSILLAGYITCIVKVIPPENLLMFKLGKTNYFSLKRWSSFTTLFKGLYQFPDVSKTYYWNTNLFTSFKLSGCIFSLLTPLLVIKLFFRKPLSLFIILFSSFIVMLFFFSELMHNYTVRHWGILFLAFYAALWLEKSIDQEYYSEKLRKFKIPTFLFYESNTGKELFVYSVLIVQCFGGIYMFAEDIKKPFSRAKAVAQYIQGSNYSNDLIIVSNFVSGPAISAYLDKKIYYPEYHNFGSYGIWSTWPYRISKNEVMQSVSHPGDKKYSRAIFITNEKIIHATDTLINGKTYIHHLKTFDHAVVRSENYEVYLVIYQ